MPHPLVGAAIAQTRDAPLVMTNDIDINDAVFGQQHQSTCEPDRLAMLDVPRDKTIEALGL